MTPPEGTEHPGAVDRVVTDATRNGKPARRVTLQRRYDTTPEDLWDALTSPERLPRWLLPVSGELKLGGVDGKWQVADPDFFVTDHDLLERRQ